MTLNELQAAVAAMPPAEWVDDGRGIVRRNPDYPNPLRPNEPQYYSVLYGEVPADIRRGIVALRNHFAAFAERYEKMREACQASVSNYEMMVAAAGGVLQPSDDPESPYRLQKAALALADAAMEVR